MSEVEENLLTVRRRMQAACSRAGRDLSEVELVAVSKTFPVDSVRDAMDAGQVAFGESRLQEAEPKIECLPGSLKWHFIGRVQRNKVRKLLPHFGWIHGVDSAKLAAYMNEVAGELGLFPKVFLQVNVGDEASKGGFEVDALRAELDTILSLDRLEIMGLMCIPPPGPDAGASRPWFVRLRELRDALEIDFGVKLPALSMGMSDDFEVAIEEGATHVRVGSAIFGKRPPASILLE
ncbi:MAG: YggS family pyridoxal phosphate-dependent enzyme [Akkermansiaceae bacterium]|nr:YggS family pyridoxal phosphate-dependent enzyme [Akkermansiaceae bacterium]